MLACLARASRSPSGCWCSGPISATGSGGGSTSKDVFGWLWWTVQWPILVFGLLAVFAVVLYLGPNVDHPRWRFLTPGAIVAVVVWLARPGLFAVYVSVFGSYNKAWGSLAAVIIMLTWLWLSALALLLGAEVNAEAERSRSSGGASPPKSSSRLRPRRSGPPGYTRLRAP